MLALLNDSSGITSEEQEILDKVWFEVNFLSTLKEHRNGVVIDSAEDYTNAIQEINDAELTVIPMKYQPVDNL